MTGAQSDAPIRPNEQTVTVRKGKLGKGIHGFYKWDTKPDQASGGQSKSIDTKLTYGQLINQAEYREGNGLKNAASLYRTDAEKNPE